MSTVSNGRCFEIACSSLYVDHILSCLWLQWAAEQYVDYTVTCTVGVHVIHNDRQLYGSLPFRSVRSRHSIVWLSYIALPFKPSNPFVYIAHVLIGSITVLLKLFFHSFLCSYISMLIKHTMHHYHLTTEAFVSGSCKQNVQSGCKVTLSFLFLFSILFPATRSTCSVFQRFNLTVSELQSGYIFSASSKCSQKIRLTNRCCMFLSV